LDQIQFRPITSEIDFGGKSILKRCVGLYPNPLDIHKHAIVRMRTSSALMASGSITKQPSRWIMKQKTHLAFDFALINQRFFSERCASGVSSRRVLFDSRTATTK